MTKINPNLFPIMVVRFKAVSTKRHHHAFFWSPLTSAPPGKTHNRLKMLGTNVHARRLAEIATGSGSQNAYH